MKCPLVCWVTAVGSRACVPKLCLVRELLKAVGDMDSIPPAAPWAPFRQATHKPTPFQASSSHPQHNHSNPAWLQAVTARMYLPRRKGPAWGCRVGVLAGWAPGSCGPSLHPLATASLGMWICMAGSLLFHLPAPTDPLCSRSIGHPALGRRRSVFRRGRTQG